MRLINPDGSEFKEENGYIWAVSDDGFYPYMPKLDQDGAAFG